jgi:solute carrier family 25 (adenine nucleotide translocator) protein 4/5/6/31
MQAINFAFKDYFKKIFNVNRDKDGSAKWVAANIVAGSAAGAISTLILCL